MPSIILSGVGVSFVTRDARYISDAERWQLENLIAYERSLIGPEREITSLVVETDYLGPGMRVSLSIRGRVAGLPPE